MRVKSVGSPGCIYVLAGVNGAGKSSVLGELILQSGLNFFNPDVATKLIQQQSPGLSLEQANSRAWQEGKYRLERAIAEGRNFAFETTLGGRTITGVLGEALVSGMQVKVWYVGLATVDLHIARVAARVGHGGHDIPEGKIRERYESSRANLVRLAPQLTELLVYDNSIEADPHSGKAPQPRLLLHSMKGKIKSHAPLATFPEWAKPIFMSLRGAMKK